MLKDCAKRKQIEQSTVGIRMEHSKYVLGDGTR